MNLDRYDGLHANPSVTDDSVLVLLVMNFKNAISLYEIWVVFSRQTVRSPFGCGSVCEMSQERGL